MNSWLNWKPRKKNTHGSRLCKPAAPTPNLGERILMTIEFEEYMKTGLLGAYHPDRAVKREIDGKVLPVYRDTRYRETEEGMELQREMVVGGRMFLVRSVFPAVSSATPTQKLLRIIDNDLEKK